MKAIRTLLFVLGIILLLPASVTADKVVGSICDIEGPVFVDAFGTGDFLEAIPGESLYANSVVKTEYSGSAVIDVGGTITELAPESTLFIENLLESREKKNKFGWVVSIARAVKSVFKAAKGSSEDVVLGGRAAEAKDAEFSWITDDEDQDAFDEATDYIAAEQWAGAIALLREIINPLPGTFLPGEVDYWIGYCQYQLENYDEAAIAYSASLSEIRAQSVDPWTLPYYEEALFQLGSSSYLVGGFDEAIGAMESLIPEVSADYAPFAYMILIDSLRETGRSTSARRYLDKARSLFAGTEYAAGIDELEAALN